MENNNLSTSIKAVAALLSLVFIVVFFYALATNIKNKPASVAENGKTETAAAEVSQDSQSDTPMSVEKEADPEAYSQALSLWNDEAPLKNQLTEYIKNVTDSASKDFIPVKDRIAVFDFDGTLFCETDPNYFDYMLLMHRVLEDENYKDKASDFEKETANKIKEQNEKHTSFDGLETDHGKCVATAFAGMTFDEFNDYIAEFKKQPMESYEGMNRGDGFYEPMLEVVNMLTENDFKVYIVSGTDRFIVRGLLKDSVLDLPPSQIIGSDELVKASGQEDTDGLKYQLTKDDELILGGQFIIKNLKMNKVSVIQREIGQKPVLSFGNSTGDSSMANFVINNNPYKSLAFMLCCDDLERENGNEEKADKMYGLCEENGWTPVSMKNDWKTIYKEGVVKVTSENEELQNAA
ncbi:MAG TPA: haloacid dehalogenase-like hydrolase [Lachnospiraceae bacterium]|nr:haloacid dehalogenase-like hydrolase [Lachnospiraceae bacterium]